MAAIQGNATAEQARTRVEMQATEARARADVQVAQVRAAAVTQVAQARAAAIEAEIKRADNMAKETTARTDREAGTNLLVVSAPVLVGLGLAALLAVDYALHDVAAVQRLRMLKQLRRCEVPPTVVLREELPIERPPLQLKGLPTMVLGPSGAGKSTALALAAREAAKPSSKDVPPQPVVLIRVRLPKDAINNAGVPEVSATERLSALTQSFCAQVGYPSRPSLVSLLLSRTLSVRTSVEWTGTPQQQCSHLISGLRALFDISERLHHERVAAGVSLKYAPPVLLFDGVQDLVKDERLAAAGGTVVFNELAALLVAYCVDRKVVRAAVAGSSALLAIKFGNTGVANLNRWNFYVVEDPDPKVVETQLEKAGFNKKEAADIVERVGTRLRTLGDLLLEGPKARSANDFIALEYSKAFTEFSRLLASSGPEGTRTCLLNMLERIWANERGWCKKLCYDDLTAQEVEVLVSSSAVLYLPPGGGGVTFQSQLHRNVWEDFRRKFVKDDQLW